MAYSNHQPSHSGEPGTEGPEGEPGTVGKDAEDGAPGGPGGPGSIGAAVMSDSSSLLANIEPILDQSGVK